MRRLVILALLLLPVLPAFAEDEPGTTCDLQALLDRDDAGLLVAYDGLRKGLEIARLPRVCRHDPAPETGGIVGFLERRAMTVAPLRENGGRIDPFFAIGDASCAAVQKAGTNLPCVLAVTRYTAKREPLVPLPRAVNGTVVYTDVALEQVDAVVASMPAGPAPLMLLHRDPTGPAPSFEEALKRARKEKRPLVSDNRAHFGLGAVVVLVARHDLLGKAAADEGRRLRHGEQPRKEPRAVPGFEIWVDLAAADAIGLELSLSFLARADRLRRPKPSASGAGR